MSATYPNLFAGSGLYSKALSYGLDKILSDYRKALVELERKVCLFTDNPVGEYVHVSFLACTVYE